MLSGRKILIGVTGSIAAYKIAVLVRLLVKEGAEVKVVMTKSAKDFITPVTLSTLSKNPVLSEFVHSGGTGEWNNHVEMGLWADEMIIAPASANTLSKMANGLCDNLLTAVYLSARCPVTVAPAMDLDMYAHPSTQKNLSTLKEYGVEVLEPADGELASGLSGPGRMVEPEEILEFLKKKTDDQSLTGKKALVTAGPTFEPIDPVRFIGNHSSGKMGYAVADRLAQAGAEVHLISGPTNISPSNPAVKIDRINTAEEMYTLCADLFPDMDIAVLAAAVADYKPKSSADQKIKKNGKMNLDLIETYDIAAELGKVKKNQFVVGFALETNDEEQNAQKKLEKKNFDMIVLNSLQDKGAGFGHDTNKVSILDRDNNLKKFELKNKKEVAADIVNEIITRI